MGTATPTLLIALGLALCGAAATAHADSCTGGTETGKLFAKCFDLGNRLSLTAGSEGVGGSVKLRHLIRFDDEPDLVWKLEHTIAEATYGGWRQQLDGALYRGRFMRHARDGHIVLPFGIPKKVFLPFDIGAQAELVAIRWRPDAPVDEALHIGVINIAGLVDFARTRSFKRRWAIGPVVRWDIDVDRSMGKLGQVSEHSVSPFTMGVLNFHVESKDGLWVGDLRGEAGTQWHTKGGWQAEASAELTFERIVIAVNDRPIALTAGVGYGTATDETIARIGARVVLMHVNDKRVNLRPLRDKTTAPPRIVPKPVVAPPPPIDPPKPVEPPVTPPPVEEPPPVEGEPVDSGGGSDEPPIDESIIVPGMMLHM